MMADAEPLHDMRLMMIRDMARARHHCLAALMGVNSPRIRLARRQVGCAMTMACGRAANAEWPTGHR